MNENESVQKDHEQTQEATPEVTGEATPTEKPITNDQSEKLVPVSEAKKYRKRAQAAELILEDLKQELAAKDAELQERTETIETLERSRRIDALLLEADAIDLEAARLLTEMTVLDMDEPDLEQAVEDLQRRKPYLFQRRSTRTGALSPQIANGVEPGGDSLVHAAAEASATGSRADLLRYLRLRRSR